MIILAHRGLWTRPEERNTKAAFEAAFAAGFGVETDVRDHNGEVVIAHDIPRGGGHLAFSDFLKLYRAMGKPGVLAINIKADGLQQPILRALTEAGVGNAFVFDMAVPDALGYLKTGLNTFTRVSEYEPRPAFYEDADGLWIDCFHHDWITPQVIDGHRGDGKQIAMVSPELHGRPHQPMWNLWAPVRHLGVMVCTDLPHEAKAALG